MKLKKLVGTSGALPRTSGMAILGDAANGLVSVGSTQATALPLTFDINVVSTVAAGTGVILDGATDVGDETIVANFGANALLVYPPVGCFIQTGATNAGFSVAVGKTAIFKRVSPTLFVAITG